MMIRGRGIADAKRQGRQLQGGKIKRVEPERTSDDRRIGTSGARGKYVIVLRRSKVGLGH